jgi:hypothetical protein
MKKSLGLGKKETNKCRPSADGLIRDGLLGKVEEAVEISGPRNLAQYNRQSH